MSMDSSLAQELTYSVKLETISAQTIPLNPRVLFSTHHKTEVKTAICMVKMSKSEDSLSKNMTLHIL